MASLPKRRKPGKSAYDVITDRIIGCLEKGVIPWRQPWANIGAPKNLTSGKVYRGVNVFILSSASYSTPFWLTYKQAKERGGNVRKGEKGFPVVYWHWFDKGEQNDSAEADSGLLTKNGKIKGAKCFARYYTVFNASQCDGIETPPIESNPIAADPIPACENVVASMPNRPSIGHGGNRACYMPGTDKVQMPERTQFTSAERYYGVLYHELTHATAHQSRCNRKGNLEDWTPFGSADYSREELVAEMGSAFLCGESGIVPDTIDDSAAYIASWLKKLRNDNRCVLIAAAQAQKAADYILDRKAEARKAVA